MITAVPLEGLPEIAAGADLAEAISSSLASALGSEQLRAGDVLVIAHKVVSKAEGRIRSLADVVPSERAIRLAQTNP
jgi:coenzyme F420-0:L-glutamate ligase/coenzyme F420-1:gamma-L-glutamate ligase